MPQPARRRRRRGARQAASSAARPRWRRARVGVSAAAHGRHYLGVPSEKHSDSGRRRRLRALGSCCATSALVAAWLAVDPHTPDLAAQVYRVGLFEKLGLSVWDEHWYAGHALPGYSLLFPPLGVLVGMRRWRRSCGAGLDARCSAADGRTSARRARAGARRVRGGGASGDIWLGRLTFALGVTLALAAGVALAAGTRLAAGAAGGAVRGGEPGGGRAAGPGGPDGGVQRRSPRALLALGAAGGGGRACRWRCCSRKAASSRSRSCSFAATAAVRVGVPVGAAARGAAAADGRAPLPGGVRAVPGRPLADRQQHRALRRCCWRGRCCCARAWPSARPAAALAGTGAHARAGGGAGAGVIALWMRGGRCAKRRRCRAPGDEASYYTPLISASWTRAGPAGPFAVEVPLTRSHWEAALLAPTVSLARGWEKQLDDPLRRRAAEARADAPAYGAGCTGRRSLRGAAGRAAGPLERAGGRLIRGGLPYLREVVPSAHWRVFRVAGATPLASGPGRG